MYDFYPEAKADDRLQQDKEAGFAETGGKKRRNCHEKANHMVLFYMLAVDRHTAVNSMGSGISIFH